MEMWFQMTEIADCIIIKIYIRVRVFQTDKQHGIRNGEKGRIRRKPADQTGWELHGDLWRDNLADTQNNQSQARLYESENFPGISHHLPGKINTLNSDHSQRDVTPSTLNSDLSQRDVAPSASSSLSSAN